MYIMLNVSALWHICFRPDPYHIFAVSFDSFICMEVHSSGIEKQVDLDSSLLLEFQEIKKQTHS